MTAQKFTFSMLILRHFFLLILYPPLENSTTRITIVHKVQSMQNVDNVHQRHSDTFMTDNKIETYCVTLCYIYFEHFLDDFRLSSSDIRHFIQLLFFSSVNPLELDLTLLVWFLHALIELRSLHFWFTQ